jgi:hypothetical protein
MGVVEGAERAADGIPTHDLLHGNWLWAIAGVLPVSTFFALIGHFRDLGSLALADISRRFVALLLPPRCPEPLERQAR